jgi:DNA-binding transcriptional regulator YiaG
MTPAQEIMAIIKGVGWSQKKIARLLEIDPITVTRWSNQAKQDSGEVVTGVHTHPRPHTLRLMKLLLQEEIKKQLQLLSAACVEEVE